MNMQLGIDGFHPQRDWVAVLGGATEYSEEQVVAAFQIGEKLAKHGKGVLTGGTTGIPYAAALGAKSAGGIVIGISPATNSTGHESDFCKPLHGIDLMIYAGAGFSGRSAILLSSVQAAIFIGGKWGTLNEYAIARIEGTRVLGILSLGASILDQIAPDVKSQSDSDRQKLLTSRDPFHLVDRVCEELGRLEETTNTTTAPATHGDVCRILSEYQQTALYSNGELVY